MPDSNSDSIYPSFESFIRTDEIEQRVAKEKNVPIPIVLSPPPNFPGSATRTITTAQDASDFIIKYKDKIQEKLNENGIILFRGFPLQTPDDFDIFVSSTGFQPTTTTSGGTNGASNGGTNGSDGSSSWKDLSYEKSMSFAVRTKLSNRICTTNEGKSGGLVFHHEQAQTPLWPKYVYFCCLLPAKKGDGGETGIVSSHLVYEKLREKYPEFITKCETYGVQYTVYASDVQDTSKGAGRSWKSFFHVTTKEECEDKMKIGNWTYEWGIGPDGKYNETNPNILKCTTPKLDAVKTVGGNKKVFFNQLIATTANALEFSNVGKDGGGYDPLKDVPTQDGIDACVKFSNGESLPLDILLDAKHICEQHSVNIDWKQGDVALISNYLYMHARRPWNGLEGTRKLLASLIEEEHCTSFGQQLIV